MNFDCKIKLAKHANWIISSDYSCSAFINCAFTVNIRYISFAAKQIRFIRSSRHIKFWIQYAFDFASLWIFYLKIVYEIMLNSNCILSTVYSKYRVIAGINIFAQKLCISLPLRETPAIVMRDRWKYKYHIIVEKTQSSYLSFCFLHIHKFKSGMWAPPGIHTYVYNTYINRYIKYLT